MAIWTRRIVLRMLRLNRSPVLAISMAAGTAILVAAAAIVMAIDGATGDFLAALPEPIRQWVQRYKALSESTLGESIHCRLAYLPWSFKFNADLGSPPQSSSRPRFSW